MKSSVDQVMLWAVSRHRQPDTLGRYEHRSFELLKSLRTLHGGFTELTAVTTGSAVPVPTSFQEFKSLIETRLLGEDDFQDLLNFKTNRSLDDGVLNRIGFSITYESATHDRASSADSPATSGIRMVLQGVSAGSEPNAQAILELRQDSESDNLGTSTIRTLLDILIKGWECDVGGVYLRRHQRAIKGNQPASYAGQWLYYLPFPHLSRCLPPDIRHEPFANGILIQTTPHMPDANNPADVAAGKRVAEVLDEFGLVNDATYAISGWPPDAEETIYEQFISGAPANRKYAVHCINFDGYDPDRKVLLYAKLFRRLQRHPKAWGLRGWDGPVLNEAKRQVRAAEKAGGVPIEWHIGFEEPALQVRQLLADYTSITEQQLRVIHTPLEEALSNRPPS